MAQSHSLLTAANGRRFGAILADPPWQFGFAIGKLLYRLNAGRNGGCPVLVVGITPACVSDWPAA